MVWVRFTAVLALVTVAGAARAQSIEEADAHYAATELDQARRAYLQALAASRLGPREVAHAHRRLGTIAAALGDEATARAAFRRALAIQPDLAAPADLAPDQREAFEALRAVVRPLLLHIEETSRDDEEVTLAASIEGGEGLEMHAVFLHPAAEGDALTLRGLDFETGTELRITAVVRDEHGNGLALERRVIRRPGVSAGASGLGRAAPPRRALKVGLLVAAGVLLVAGVVAVALWRARADETPVYPNAMVEF